MHTGVSVAVGDIDVAFRRERRVRATAERTTAHRWCGLSRRADDEENTAVRRALPHAVIAVVGAVEISVRADIQAVRIAEHSLSPRAQEAAIAIEHDHRVRAAIEQVHLFGSVPRQLPQPPPATTLRATFPTPCQFDSGIRRFPEYRPLPSVLAVPPRYRPRRARKSAIRCRHRSLVRTALFTTTRGSHPCWTSSTACTSAAPTTARS